MLKAVALIDRHCRGPRRLLERHSGRSAAPPAARPSILLVTLDTTRADAIGPEARGIETPAFNALAARGRRFRQAYATVPETLPSHSSMMTGLYPAGHGVHENARFLDARMPVLAERLKAAGYRTAGFVSSFVLVAALRHRPRLRRVRRRAAGGRQRAPGGDDTTDARARLPCLDLRRSRCSSGCTTSIRTRRTLPPEPFRTRYAATPVSRRSRGDGRTAGPPGPGVRGRRGQVRSAIVVAADHGEGLGDHGEMQHGSLLYQSTMHVPLVLVGPGIAPGVSRDAGQHPAHLSHRSRLGRRRSVAEPARTEQEVVLGEAMKPFLEYGWQPQTMAVATPFKGILAGTLETYDLAADPAESRNLGAGVELAGRDAEGAGRLPHPVRRRPRARRTTWTRTPAGGWPALATSVPPRRRSCGGTRRDRPT